MCYVFSYYPTIMRPLKLHLTIQVTVAKLHDVNIYFLKTSSDTFIRQVCKEIMRFFCPIVRLQLFPVIEKRKTTILNFVSTVLLKFVP